MSKQIYLTVSEEEYTIAKKMDFFILEKRLRPEFEKIINEYTASEKYNGNTQRY